MKLSILLPVYNEERTLEGLMGRLLALNIDKDIIAVDDCSRDGSVAILEKYSSDSFRLIRHAKNQGKGAAVRTALAHARGDYVIIQDADTELDPDDIPRLLEPILRGEARVVYGARDLRAQSKSNWLGNKLLTLATNLLFGTRISDMETCYKVMPTAIMRSLELQANGFDIEPEITAKLARAGQRIVERPIAYHPRVVDKKMRPIREGLRALRALIRYRFRE
jgi:glycosyltransferase involved in cell wall biosynthesis